MNNKDFANKAFNIASNYRTAYVWGTFGLVANSSNMQRMLKQYSINEKHLKAAKSIYDRGFFFDCVGLIKGILWGWYGDTNRIYGGAVYMSNNVPDISADQMITVCKNVSTDFSKIEVGEVVWIPGHIGIYIGNGKVIEATPAFNGGVQITACSNIREISGFYSRKWTKHGRLPYITYIESNVDLKKPLETGNDIVWELMNGKYKIEINDVPKAVKAIDKAKNDFSYNSLYWILYKLVNKQ